MHIFIKISLIFVISMFAASCDQMISKASSKVFKYSLRDKCGEGEVACKAAVDNLFDKCQSKYEKEWDAYLYANESEEDEPLRIYSEKMYACIVDENGTPYFEYNPE